MSEKKDEKDAKFFRDMFAKYGAFSSNGGNRGNMSADDIFRVKNKIWKTFLLMAENEGRFIDRFEHTKEGLPEGTLKAGTQKLRLFCYGLQIVTTQKVELGHHKYKLYINPWADEAWKAWDDMKENQIGLIPYKQPMHPVYQTNLSQVDEAILVNKWYEHLGHALQFYLALKREGAKTLRERARIANDIDVRKRIWVDFDKPLEI